MLQQRKDEQRNQDVLVGLNFFVRRIFDALVRPFAHNCASISSVDSVQAHGASGDFAIEGFQSFPVIDPFETA